MGISNLKKFKEHLVSGGLLYAVWRAIKYFVFILRQKDGRKQGCFIEAGSLRLFLSDYGIQVFWSGKKLTMGSGLNVGVNALGLWTDSTKAKWRLLQKNADSFKIRVAFERIPLIQVWKINICGRGHFVWEIESQNTKWLHVDELRIIHLLNPVYTHWFCGYEQEPFCRFQKDWFDFKVHQPSFLLTGVRFSKEETDLPSLSFEIDSKKAKVLIQNSSERENLRIIGFSIIDKEDKRNLPPGSSQSFRTDIRIFEDDSELDSRIEFLRQDVVRGVLEENKLPCVNTIGT